MKKDISKTFIEIGIFLLILLIVAIVVFFILEKTGNNPFVNSSNKKVNTDEALIKREITTYLASNEKPNDVEGNCFASFKDYGTDQKDNNTIYIQYYVQCYKLGENEITTLNGYTIPAKVVLEKNKDNYKVKEIVKPSESNVNSLFPATISVELSKAKEDGTIKTLKDNVDKQAKDYYGDLNIK